MVRISIHALLAESDYDGLIASANFCNFYPRSPCGERLFSFRFSVFDFLFLSTLSLRRATAEAFIMTNWTIISIHALLAESDIPLLLGCTMIHISIHALLAESDSHGCYSLRYPAQFLSTLSLRRATWPRAMNPSCLYFYPRSPCGERLDYYAI